MKQKEKRFFQLRGSRSFHFSPHVHPKHSIAAKEAGDSKSSARARALSIREVASKGQRFSRLAEPETAAGISCNDRLSKSLFGLNQQEYEPALLQKRRKHEKKPRRQRCDDAPQQIIMFFHQTQHRRVSCSFFLCSKKTLNQR